MSDLVQQFFAIAERRDRRFHHRWVLSPKHVQAIHDEENARRSEERERLAAIPAQVPGFDPTEYLKWNEPLPPPDYAKVDEWRVLGWPVRVADVEEITLEPIRPRQPWGELEWDEG